MSEKENCLRIVDLHVQVNDKKILKGVNLEIKKGEIHALMGPNGSGKSTLAATLMGHPNYKITKGEIWLDGQNITDLSPDERARMGLFLAFQYPSEVPGVTVANFLRLALNAVRGKDIPVLEFHKLLHEKMKELKMDPSFAKRYLNDGFSGGEKKRNEILQMALLQPKYAILDETDSGLDIDALRIVSEGVNRLVGPDLGILIITHYQRILHYIEPHYVHVLYDGKIIESGGKELADKLEKTGYDFIHSNRSESVLEEAQNG
jgi:Fe-S cluster assembly ATP-binding protein